MADLSDIIALTAVGVGAYFLASHSDSGDADQITMGGGGGYLPVGAVAKGERANAPVVNYNIKIGGVTVAPPPDMRIPTKKQVKATEARNKPVKGDEQIRRYNTLKKVAKKKKKPILDEETGTLVDAHGYGYSVDPERVSPFVQRANWFTLIGGE